MEKKMKNKMFLILIFMALSFSSFAAKYVDITKEYSIPPEMKNCKIFMLYGGAFSYSNLYVTHCPNSHASTSYQNGKVMDSVVGTTSSDVIEINGDKYIKIK